MTKIYIDFDGVILDTWSVISSEYYDRYGNLEIDDSKVKEIMLDIGFDNIISRSNEINNSISKILELSKYYDVCILSKVNSSLESEAKKKFLLSKNINKFEFVSYDDTKGRYATDSSILIDDSVKNLDEFVKSSGIGVFFNKNLENIDDYGIVNDKYIILDDLLKICDIIDLRMED